MTGGLLAVSIAALAGHALAVDGKVYHGAFCKSVGPWDEVQYTPTGFLMADGGPGSDVICPLVRDNINATNLYPRSARGWQAGFHDLCSGRIRPVR